METDLLDYALTLGMSSDQYWYDDPRLLDNYEQVFHEKSRMKIQEAWSNGMYFKAALQSTMVVSIPAFNPRKYEKGMAKYPDNPAKYNSDGELTESEQENQRKQLYQMFKNMKARG